MAATLKIKETEGKLHIYTPYNQEFVSKIRLVAGSRWDGSLKCWTTDADKIDIVRDIMKKIYGYTDQPATNLVKVKVITTDWKYAECADLVLFGKTLSHAWGRDTGASAGEDVTFLEGRPESGGSVKRWNSEVEKNCVIILDNVAEDMLEEGDWYTYEVISREKVDMAALEEEKKKLLARLAEIEKLLNGGAEA